MYWLHKENYTEETITTKLLGLQIVFKSIKQKMHVAEIFCDLAKTFDCINHEIVYLNDIFMEFEECMKTGSGPI
jgi:hypothetical protein